MFELLIDDLQYYLEIKFKIIIFSIRNQLLSVGARVTNINFLKLL